MKHLTVLGALLIAANGVQAQSGVTIYGVLDIAVTTARQGSGTTLPGGSVPTTMGPSSVTRVDSNVGPGSRLGFRGSEDLGGGLSANFVLEQGIAVDSGTLTQGGLAFGRLSWVGLASKSGWSLTAGRQLAPIAIGAGSSDALGFWGNASGQMGFGLYESVAASPLGGSFLNANRVANSLMGTYGAGNFVGRVMVSAGDENVRGTGKVFSTGLSYMDKKTQINFAYARVRQNVEQLTATADPESVTEWHLGGNYDFGPVNVFAGYFLMNGVTNRANLSAAFNNSPFTYSWRKAKSTWLGARIPVTVGRVAVQVTNTDFDYVTGPQGKALMLGASYEYDLSKRTSLYVSYGQVRNNAYSNAPLFASIVAVMPNGYGADHRAASIGVRHSF